MSLWRIPGLDQDTFYAAALYLHAAAAKFEVKPLYREAITPEATRDFLDHLADCFARSKLQDSRDHVSAAAMVRHAAQKKITVYIAKNQSENGSRPFASEEAQAQVENENQGFAETLKRWFDKMALGMDDNPLHDDRSNIFKTMCKFSWSRLEHYIQKVSQSDADALDHDVEFYLNENLDCNSKRGWKDAQSLIKKCEHYQSLKTDSKGPCEQLSLLVDYATAAGRTRKTRSFRHFAGAIETLAPKICKVIKWIRYLGRLYTACDHFQEFCSKEEQKKYSFGFVLLPSTDHPWNGDAYERKINSWAGELGLTERPEARISADGNLSPTVKTLVKDIVKTSNNTARVHCEMQLLMHFAKSNADRSEDYFGCSKESCWLCWQMILKNSTYTMKGSHRKLYPRWAFPFDYSASQPEIVEGLLASYSGMMSLIQHQVIGQTPLKALKTIPQTSTRMTPAHQRNLPGGHFDGSESDFSSSPIAAPGRLPAYVVSALHLPANGPPTASRLVDIHAYERSHSGAIEANMRATEYDGRSLIFAFQLLTKPASSKLPPSVHEYRRAFWNEKIILRGTSTMRAYSMYFRTDLEVLSQNPCLSSIWAITHPEGPQYSLWRGDAFIFRGVEPGHPHETEVDFGSESPFDDKLCLTDLEDHLFDLDAGYLERQISEDTASGLAFLNAVVQRQQERLRFFEEASPWKFGGE